MVLAGCTADWLEWPVEGVMAGEAVAEPTWHEHVQPLMAEHCLGCHAEGGIAPMPLDTPEEAASHAATIALSAEIGSMPPWMPARPPACAPLVGDRTLAPWHVQTLANWAANGAPEGDPAAAPEPAPVEVERLTAPDRTLVPAEAYEPRQQGDRDDYHCFALDPELTEDVAVTAFQFVPDQIDLVHHVLFYAVDGEAMAAKVADEGPGWTCYGGPDVRGSTLIGGWVPGTTVTRFPEGTGLGLDADAGIVAEVHYNTAKGSRPDRSSLLLEFAEEPVDRRLFWTSSAQRNLAIPPNTTDHRATLQRPIDGPARVWGILPHMHERGRSIRVWRERPGEPNACWIDIPEWDFGWQQFYFFDLDGGLEVDEGDVLHGECAWDNPTDQRIEWGESTTDEMCLIYFLYSLE